MPPLPSEIDQLFQLLAVQDEALRESARTSLTALVQRLALRVEKYEDLLNTFFHMANATTRDEVTRLIIGVARRITGSAAASFFRYDQSTNTLEASALVGGAEEQLSHKTLPANAGIVGKVIASKEPVCIADVQNDKHFFKAFDEETGFVTRTIVAVPVLLTDGTILGVVETLNKKEGAYDDADREILELLAKNIAIVHRMQLL